jgi:hypothetical protein
MKLVKNNTQLQNKPSELKSTKQTHNASRALP